MIILPFHLLETLIHLLEILHGVSCAVPRHAVSLSSSFDVFVHFSEEPHLPLRELVLPHLYRSERGTEPWHEKVREYWKVWVTAAVPAAVI